METSQLTEPGLAFEQFMASMQELRKSQEETTQQLKETGKRFGEIDKLLAETVRGLEETKLLVKETSEQMKDTDRQLKDTDRQVKETAKQMKDTAKQMKDTDRRVGGITNRFGEVVEYMVMPNLVTKFAELGFEFTRANRTEITDRKHNIITEIDAFLENGDKVMVVEIKTKPSVEDINDHIERMKKLRAYADLNNDKRNYLGAMAGVVFSVSAKTYALTKGFYVIEPSGDTFTITEPKGEYHPHIW
jgi:chromosome segregation ATPase